jgi:hypothetical protein
MSVQLSWPRLKALLRNDVIGGYRNWLIASAVIAGVLLIGAMLAVNGNGPDASFYRVTFFPTLLIWGTIASSAAFSELHDKSKNTAYLLLPASALEKTLAPLLSTTIVLIAYLLVFTAVASVAIEGINRVLYGRANDLFNPFEAEIWASVPRYIVAQSLFFLGAAWFRKGHYIRTLLAVLICGFALAGLAVLAFWVAGVITLTPVGPQVQADVGEWLFLPSPSLSEAIGMALTILGFVVLPIFCWFVAWLRVAETQVSHGV